MIKTILPLYAEITILSRYIILHLNPRKACHIKLELCQFNQWREHSVTKGHYGSCLTLLLYDKDQS